MADKGTKKKITRVGGPETASTIPASNTPPPTEATKPYVTSDENKAKAKKYRLIAVISWIIAIGLEVGAILLLNKKPVPMVWLIVLIVADLIFAVIGSMLWKKSNKFNPASQKEPIRFFIQNQLGAIISVIAFLPLIILIFTNKNMTGKQKGLAGAVGIIALVIAGFLGIDFNPPSQEKYQEQAQHAKDSMQTEQVKELNNGIDHVYWTKSGKSYHLYSDCGYINTDRTDEIFEGTVYQAKQLKNITDICDRCANRAKKEKEALLRNDSVK
ncbi:MAG: hypothetical protein WC401_05860 [Bacteroidales bacterium]